MSSTTDDRIDCEEALRLLADYLDEELGEAGEAKVARHLETCRSCFSRAEFERRLKERLTELGREEVPGTLEGRIRTLIRQFPGNERPGAAPAEP